MSGPLPKPTQLRVLAGNPSKRPLPEREPQPPRYQRLPPPPGHLGKTAAAAYQKMGRLLNRMGLLTRVDVPALEAYCVAYGRWSEAEEKVKELGPVVKTTGGNLIQNPYLSVANKAMKQMREWMAEFGLTPAARTRVTATAAEEPDELERLLRRAK